MQDDPSDAAWPIHGEEPRSEDDAVPCSSISCTWPKAEFRSWLFAPLGHVSFSRRTQGQQSRTETASDERDAAPPPGPPGPPSSWLPPDARTAGPPAASLWP